MVTTWRAGRSAAAAAIVLGFLAGCGKDEPLPTPAEPKGSPVKTSEKADGDKSGGKPDDGTVAKGDPRGTTPKSGTTPTDPFLEPNSPQTTPATGTGGVSPKGGAETPADLTVVGEKFVVGLLIRPGAISRAPAVTGIYAAVEKDLQRQENELVEQANMARQMSGLEPGDVDQVLVLADLDALQGLAALGAPRPRPARPAPDLPPPGKGENPPKSDAPEKSSAKDEGAAANRDSHPLSDGTRFVLFEDPAAEPAPPAGKAQPGAAAPADDAGPDDVPFAIPGRVGLMIHVRKPIDRAKLDAFLPPDAAEKEHAGQKYRLVGPFAVCLLGDQTLLAGNEAGVQHMLDARSGKGGPLREQLRSAAEHQFVLALQIDRATELIGQAAQALGPGGIVAVAYAGQFKRVTLALDLSGPSLASLHAEMINADSAANIAPLFQNGLNDARTKFAEAKKDPESKEHPGFVKLIDDVLDRSTVRADGAHLHVEIPMPAGFDQLAETLAPLIEKSRKAAERTRRMNDLRQIALALHNAHAVDGRIPAADGPGYGPDFPKEQSGKLSWRVYLLPFLSENELFREFKLDEAWDGPTNKPLIARMPKVFGTDPEGRSRYHVIVGAKSGSAFAKFGGIRFGEATDGTSATLAVVEAGPDKADVWTKPGGLEFDPATSTVATLLGNVGEEFLVIMLDGSVQTRPKTLAPDLLKALITIAGGENTGPKTDDKKE